MPEFKEILCQYLSEETRDLELTFITKCISAVEKRGLFQQRYQLNTTQIILADTVLSEHVYSQLPSLWVTSPFQLPWCKLFVNTFSELDIPVSRWGQYYGWWFICFLCLKTLKGNMNEIPVIVFLSTNITLLYFTAFCSKFSVNLLCCQTLTIHIQLHFKSPLIQAGSLTGSAMAYTAHSSL